MSLKAKVGLNTCRELVSISWTQFLNTYPECRCFFKTALEQVCWTFFCLRHISRTCLFYNFLESFAKHYRRKRGQRKTPDTQHHLNTRSESPRGKHTKEDTKTKKPQHTSRRHTRQSANNDIQTSFETTSQKQFTIKRTETTFQVLPLQWKT